MGPGPPPTLEVQVLGPAGSLSGDLGVDLHRVQVVGVPGDDDIVPVVVVQGLVGVALDQVGPVPKVGHVVKVPGGDTHKMAGTGERGAGDTGLGNYGEEHVGDTTATSDVQKFMFKWMTYFRGLPVIIKL